MRIKAKAEPQPQEGDARTKTGFLWLPKKINEEWRWLERATWIQVCMRLPTLMPEPTYTRRETHLQWVSTEWV